MVLAAFDFFEAGGGHQAWRGGVSIFCQVGEELGAKQADFVTVHFVNESYY